MNKEVCPKCKVPLKPSGPKIITLKIKPKSLDELIDKQVYKYKKLYLARHKDLGRFYIIYPDGSFHNRNLYSLNDKKGVRITDPGLEYEKYHQQSLLDLFGETIFNTLYE